MDRWASRYLHDLKASLAALQGSEPGSKPWLAAAVAVGEQQLLQQLKKEALMIMLGAAQVRGQLPFGFQGLGVPTRALVGRAAIGAVVDLCSTDGSHMTHVFISTSACVRNWPMITR
jgi:hypothetical protein